MRSWPAWRLPAFLGIGLLAVLGGYLGARLAVAPSVPLTYVQPPPVSAAIAEAGVGMPVAAEAPVRTVATAVAEALPSLTILVAGLGLAEAPTRAAIGLSAEIVLAFSPYAERTVEWQRSAAEAGHEVLVELPTEPSDSTRIDAGPQVIRVASAAADKVRSLEWVLERSVAPRGLLVSAGGFAAAPGALAPIIDQAAGRGLAVVETGGAYLADATAVAGVSHLSATGPLDRDPQPDAIDAALRGAEAAARRTGRAVAYLRPYPVSLARLAAWSASLDRTSIRLASLGNLLGGERPEGGRR